MAQVIVNIIISFLLYIVLAYGINITYRTTRFINLSYAISLTVSAYLVYSLYQGLELPLFLSIIISILLISLLNYFLEIYLFLPLRNRGSTSMVLIIASLGIYIILQNISSILWGDSNKSFDLPIPNTSINIFNAYITNIQLLTMCIFTLIIVIYSILLKYSRLGKNIKAISINTQLAEIFGVKINRLIVYSTIFCSIICSIVGILVALDTGISSSMGFKLLLFGIVVLIIGGANFNWGIVFGALLLATAQHLGAFIISSKWIDCISYAILILFLIWKPLGFSGNQLKKTEI